MCGYSSWWQSGGQAECYSAASLAPTLAQSTIPLHVATRASPIAPKQLQLADFVYTRHCSNFVGAESHQIIAKCNQFVT